VKGATVKYLKRHIGRTLLVVTAGGDTFKGRLAAVTRDSVVLGGVTTVGPSGGPLDGLVAVPTGAVTWVQVV
jgi:hypothetical protein